MKKIFGRTDKPTAPLLLEVETRDYDTFGYSFARHMEIRVIHLQRIEQPFLHEFMKWGFSDDFDDAWQYFMEAHIAVGPPRPGLENQRRLRELGNVGRKRILFGAFDSTTRETRRMREQMVNSQRRLDRHEMLLRIISLAHVGFASALVVAFPLAPLFFAIPIRRLGWDRNFLIGEFRDEFR